MRVSSISALLALVLAGSVSGQRLYRKDMDAAAQAAVKAMEKVGSKDLFGTMLQNLSMQSAQDFDTTFSGIRRQTRAHIQTWDNWCSVNSDMVDTMIRLGYPGLQVPNPGPFKAARPAGDDEAGKHVENRSEALRVRDLNLSCRQLLEKKGDAAQVRKDNIDQLATLLTQLKEEEHKRRKEIDDLKNAPETNEPRLLALLGQAGNLTEVEQGLNQFAALLPSGTLTSLAAPAKETVAVLKRLGTAYQDYKTRRDEITKVKDQLGELKSEMLKITVLKLVAEEEHLGRLVAIEARRACELEDAAESFEEYRDIVICERDRDEGFDLRWIDDSLRELGQSASLDLSNSAPEYLYAAKKGSLGGSGEEKRRAFCKDAVPPRVRLQSLSRALFQAAAVETRGATPEYLAELRRAQEEQRYSIVQSSLEARAYETLVNTGVQRLALLHAGGIKPAQVAQLVFDAGQLAGVSLIAAKQ